MKRIVTIIAAITMLVSGMAAQTRALATLSHEGQLTFFDKVSALEDAIEAAVDGDIIYLSDGKFGASQQKIEIRDKQISIIGNGFNSHIMADIIYIPLSDVKLESPMFDGVRLENLDIGLYSNGITNDFEIKKCKISKINLGYYCDNIVIDRCLIDIYNNSSSSKNVRFYNCKIYNYEGYSQCEILENCNINKLTGYPSYIVNSIINELITTNTNVIYENSLLGSVSTSYSYEFRNCYNLTGIYPGGILDENHECIISDMSPYVGTDGTVVGIYGGEWFPYSETPSVPTVDSAKSSVEYDKDNNQLKVTITVAPN